MKTNTAKKLIRDLLDAGHDGVLAQFQDGGKKVDIVFSRRRGHTDEVMSLAEAERRIDAAIRQAWKELTGGVVRGDPVEFINSR
jgi:hypothetical protein